MSEPRLLELSGDVWEAFERPLSGRKLAVFLDYDGTLTPIVARPEDARLSAAARRVLERLATTWPTVILSGRGRDDVRALVGLESVTIAGSHGFDISGPNGLRHEVAPGLRRRVTDAFDELVATTADIDGTFVENKVYSLSVHYRHVAESEVARVEALVDEAARHHSGLRKTGGKKVFELRPDVPWDKGRAIVWILDEVVSGPVLPLFFGDDVTDEDGFHAIRDRGIGVLVSDEPRPTEAHWRLRDTDEVLTVLDRLAALG